MLILFIWLGAGCCEVPGQSPPWENPLKIAWSGDGISFGTPVIFQDSSGVPSVIRWRGDTLICAFQWFRLPVNTPSWDRVAVKFSYDNGLNWTAPVPIVIDGIPANYQRPFDPTLAVFSGDSIRIYYSSSEGLPMGGLNASVNTYSAKSADGVHYVFEPGARVDEPANRVIDPAVIFFNQAWHYAAPVGSPQAGAYHYLSPDGLQFSAVPPIGSDAQHNWTGNYMVNTSEELRFYGAGPNGIWFNTSPNGGSWNGYTNTNIRGGDPSVVRIADDQYLMIFVGQPYSVAVTNAGEAPERLQVFPNPAEEMARISYLADQAGEIRIAAYDVCGKYVCQIFSGFQTSGRHTVIWDRRTSGKARVTPGIYFVRMEIADRYFTCRVIWR